MRGNAIRPALSGFFDFKIIERMHQNRTVLITPLNTGEMNQEPMILPVEKKKILIFQNFISIVDIKPIPYLV